MMNAFPFYYYKHAKGMFLQSHYKIVPIDSSCGFCSTSLASSTVNGLSTGNCGSAADKFDHQLQLVKFQENILELISM